MSRLHILIVGAGVYGVTGAISLAKRGHNVTLVDPGPLPHPLAASTDISKVVRMEYGDDADYMALVEQARLGWLDWNRQWGRDLYHETGVLMMSREPMTPGGFEYESFQLLRKRGHKPERIDPQALKSRFPAWDAANYPDGFFHADGGYAESGAVIAQLLCDASELSIEVRADLNYARWTESGDKVTGIESTTGERLHADHVVLAGGAWSYLHHPELRECLRAIGQPVFQLKPADPSPFRPEVFPVYTADVARTGWYGFPVNRDGIVKIGNHGPGRIIHPDEPREVLPSDIAAMRAFVAETFPALADAPLFATRLCLYSDSWDSHFWIARDPNREGLTVATGGSGHAFKFAPVLGDLIADAVEGRENPYSKKFRWRPEVRPAIGAEAARYYGEP